MSQELLEVGSYVVCGNIPGYSGAGWPGAIGKVVNSDPSNNLIECVVTNTISGSEYTLWVTSWARPDAALAHTLAKRDEYKKRLAEAEERYNVLDQKFERTVTLISDALLEEASDRDWCGEYDEKVSDLNDILPGPYKIRTRRELKLVRVQSEGTVRVYHDVYVWVEGDDDENDVATDPDNWVDEEGRSDDIQSRGDVLQTEIDNNGWDEVSTRAVNR